MRHKIKYTRKKHALGKWLTIFCTVAGVILLLAAPAITVETPAEDGLLYRLMEAEPEKFAEILANPHTYEVQLLFTEIKRDANNIPSFTTHSYNLDSKRYFYPASTVKLPVALLALQKLHQLDNPDINSACRLSRGDGQGGATVAEHLRRIFYYSDNDSYHYLYDFLGVDYINETLHGMGYKDCLIFRKFTITNARQDANTPAMTLLNEGAKVYRQPAQTVKEAYSLEDWGLSNIIRGYSSHKNFSNWNYVSIEALQLMLQSVVLPQTVEARYCFDISEDDRLLLMDYMRGSGSASHKYFLYGGAGTVAEGIEIYNKTGTGYGNILDNAYIVDKQNGLEFLLTAVIYVNPNGVIGDDNYAYDTVGMPFLRDIGNAVHNYLLEQKGVARHE